MEVHPLILQHVRIVETAKERDKKHVMMETQWMMMDVQAVRSILDGLVMDKAQINVEIVEMDSRSKSNNVMMVIQITMMAAQIVS